MTFRNTKKYMHDKELFVAAEGIYTGQFLYCGKKAQLVVGNTLPIGSMPEGSIICNVEAKLGDVVEGSTPARPSLAGFLLKRGRINKEWRRRWFRLQGNKIWYFRQAQVSADMDPHEASSSPPAAEDPGQVAADATPAARIRDKPRGSVTLSGCEVSQSEEEYLVLKIETPVDGRVMLIQAANPAEMFSWIS